MLEQFFQPKSIAVVGASRNPVSAGHGVLKSLLTGGVLPSPTNKAFKGKVFPVNPNASSILGKKSYKKVTDIPGKIDLAVIAVRASLVKEVIYDCAKKGVKGVIIIAAGFGESNEQGKTLESEVKELARKSKIRLIGPNCLGIFRPSMNLNASFGPCMPLQGNIAFFSQSGALIDSVIDWSLEKKFGFSAIVSLGNSSDLEMTDFLSWASNDAATKAVAIYLEGIHDGRKLMEIVKTVSRKKPVVFLKAGRHASGMHAVQSHTGNLAGNYEVFKAAMLQSGAFIANDVDELFELAHVLALQPSCENKGIAIITNGGGAGVLCADHCEDLGINLAKLSKKTIGKLDSSGVMHPAYSRNNPLDLVGDALADRYKVAINTVLAQPDVSGLIVIQTLQTMTESLLDAKVILSARKKFPKKPIIACYMGGKFSRKGVAFLEAHHIPDFNIPLKSARAMKALIERNAWLKR